MMKSLWEDSFGGECPTCAARGWPEVPKRCPAEGNYGIEKYLIL